MSDKKASFTTKAEDRAYIDAPAQPVVGAVIPKVSTGSRNVGGVRYFAPHLPADGDVQILLVGVAPTPEEAQSVETTKFGYEVQVKPQLFRGAMSTIVRDAAGMHSSIKAEKIGYVTLCPWLLPKNSRYRPGKEILPQLKERLESLVAEIKPKIIVAAGKVVFDQLCAFKINHGDARGCWFDHNGIPLYLIEALSSVITKPWTIETLITDFREVNRMYEFCQDVPRALSISAMRMRVIDTEEQLRDLVKLWAEGGFREFSVDCEWGGDGFTDGRLRSIQFSWTEQDACYLRFFDEHNKLYLGAGEGLDDEGEVTHWTAYRKIGAILAAYLDLDHVSYIAHHASADTPWMEQVLGLKVAGKVSFDTEFAMQTADEYAPLGLDDLALRFTAFGRYDQPLVMWKRANKLIEGDGYAKVPDEILIPYAMLDVLTVTQAKPKIERMLERQELLTYYRSHLNPFVTDVFHDWCVQGLPIDLAMFQKLREFMNWSYAKLQDDLWDALAKQADELLEPHLVAYVGPIAAEMRDNGQVEEALELLKKSSTAKPIPATLLHHWVNVRSFNIRSSPQMRVWLFDIMGFTPVKTTKGGESGMPQMLWDRVLELPEAMQKLAVPATDKETLEILSAKDDSGMLLRCLAVSNVGNQCKGFLKAGDKGPDGEIVEEHGLAKFISSDVKIHPNFSLTETTRPRTWKPNILNLSSHHNAGVATGLARVVEHIGVPDEFAILFSADGIMPDMPAKKLIKDRMPTVRSIVTAAENWCFTESDWVTAEVRGLAFISGDHALIKLITERDPYFGLVDIGGKKEKVRIAWEDSKDIPTELCKPEFLFSVWDAGKLVKAGTEADLLRDKEGKIIHPQFDLHWLLSEMVNHQPREMLRDKVERSASKVTRFCIAEGELVLTREHGWIPIQEVSLCDHLWDGVEWVPHDGVAESGVKEVMFYQGLWASALHKVWRNTDGWHTLWEARVRGLELCRDAPEGIEFCGGWYCATPGNAATDHEWQVWRGAAMGGYEKRASHSRVAPTYDILNAGPRNRFACSGVIVSNSAVYGAVAATIERRIEALTGVKPEEGTGQQLLEALANSQPVADQFLIDISDYPARGIPLIAASGRKRRFPIHSGELQGLPWRARKAYLRAMGNEARNFFMQESVAATLSRSCSGIRSFVRRQNLEGRCLIGLYDAALTHSPMQERFLMREIHQLFMQDINCWPYHGRWMNYPVETDFVTQWSFKPSDDIRNLLYDPEYMPMPKTRDEQIRGEIERIRDTFFAVQPSLVAKLNRV